ncbi:hypothetical protein SFR_3016 [Streptomyces sp. FR-008]|nr:hypothetical protein SFR_3016 [Streptomyces sp. FR-008]
MHGAGVEPVPAGGIAGEEAVRHSVGEASGGGLLNA